MFITTLDWLRVILFLTNFKSKNIKMALVKFNGTKNATARAQLTETISTGYLGST